MIVFNSINRKVCTSIIGYCNSFNFATLYERHLCKTESLQFSTRI